MEVQYVGLLDEINSGDFNIYQYSARTRVAISIMMAK
jgi:hypothetical protein